MRKLKKYKPTKFMAKTSHYDKDAADYAVMFIESLCHTKGTWAGKPFELIDWQEQIIRDLFGVLKPNGYRQFNTAYIEIPKKQGKSELAAAVALLLLCGDGEERAEVYGCAAVPEGCIPGKVAGQKVSGCCELLADETQAEEPGAHGVLGVFVLLRLGACRPHILRHLA